MTKKAVPMIHVPDVRATVDWYLGIGFTVEGIYGNDGDGFSFAIVSFGDSEVMFNQGGRPSTQHRREVDLYVYTDGVDDLYQGLKDRVDVVEGPHDTFYGMREFILRDLNRFWITFGQESVFGKLMRLIQQGNAELVRNALVSADVKPETLTAALAAASAMVDNTNPEIIEILKQAGAVAAPEVDQETLQSYAGKYKKDEIEFNVSFKNGQLFAAPGNQEPMHLVAVDNTTFRPVALDDIGTVTFIVEGGQTTGCTLNHGSQKMQLARVAEGAEF